MVSQRNFKICDAESLAKRHGETCSKGCKTPMFAKVVCLMLESLEKSFFSGD